MHLLLPVILSAILFLAGHVPFLAQAQTVGLPAEVVNAGQTYVQNLQRRSTRLDATQRQQILATASLLSTLGECRQAQDLRGLSWPGWMGDYPSWMAQSQDAYCARDYTEAIGAAYQAWQMASRDSERFQALLRLAQALEADWRYAADAVLAVYRLALTQGKSTEVMAQVQRLDDELQAAAALRLQWIESRDAGDVAQLCLRFNQALPAPGAQHYGDYIRVEPAFTPRFRQGEGDEICLVGAAYGTSYQVTVLPGLQDSEGRRLAAQRRESVSVAERAPSLRFQNHLYVLPRTGGGVPVTAINVATAEIDVYRVDPRNLTASAVREGFGQDLDRWSTEQLQTQFGARVWQGQAQLPVVANQEQVVDLPLTEILQAEPGVYVVVARPVEPAQEVAQDGGEDDWGWDWESHATQWVVVSDLGLTTYRGRDGLNVVVRGLGDAQLRAQIALELVARNNRILATATTDARGWATMPASALRGRGGDEPLLLLARGPTGDFNFLDISRSPFDLSDRGVAGRPPAGALDAYVYTERGVYRPGERVHLGVLLRAETGQAAPALPVTLRLYRPDQTLAWEQVVSAAAAGGLATHLELPRQARTGRWRLEALVEREAPPVGQTEFQVQAILPPRLEAQILDAPRHPWSVQEPLRLEVQADYLFGAPAAELEVQPEIQISTEPQPFAGYPGFHFGPLDGAEDRLLLPYPAVRTDANGLAQLHLPLDLGRLHGQSMPLRALVRAEVVDEDGRAVVARAEQLLDTGAVFLGVRAPGPAGPEGHAMLNEGQPAGFAILAAGIDGQAVALDGVDYRLIEERIHYQWYRDHGNWQYRREVHTHEHEQGHLDLRADAPIELSFALPAGRYRLEVHHPSSGARSGARVQLGWGGGAARDETPDRLQVRHDQAHYLAGATARLRVTAPFDGYGQVVVATDRVLEVRPIQVRDGTAVLELPVAAEWGAGAYALVSVYRPDAADTRLGPRRAVGVAWLALDASQRQMPLTLEVPDELRPLQTLNVQVQGPPAAPDEAAYVTVSVVDDGLLQLTEQPLLNPAAHLFAQQRLGLELRDLYGRLLEGRRGQPGRIGSGAGAPGTESDLEPPVVLVSLFSEVVRLNAQGQAEVAFAIPEFEGRLRVQAVAWSARQVGHAASTVTVRDPVTLQAALPRFIGASDTVEASFRLFNTEGAAGEYVLTWQTQGALRENAGYHALVLATGGRGVLQLPLVAAAPGDGEIILRLTGPEGLDLQRQYRLTVLPTYAAQTRRQMGYLPAGAETLLGGNLAAQFVATTLTTQLSLDSRPQWDILGLLDDLERYPHICAEQRTSRAFPLLNRSELARMGGRELPDAQAGMDRQAVQQLINQLLAQQLDTGGFTLWTGPWSREADPWVSVYVLEFLGEARRRHHEVPDFAWERGLRWLQRLVNLPETRDPQRLAAQAYALYVLARHGVGRPDNARYLWEQMAEDLPSGLTAAYLGAALAISGDRLRANQAFARSLDIERQALLRDYGSPLRDRADIVRLALRHAPQALDLNALALEVAEAFIRTPWLSTQEQAALLRAAAALAGTGDALDLRLGDQAWREQTPPLALNPDITALLPGLPLHNVGNAGLWYSLVLHGHPATTPDPLAAGLHIERQWFNRQGQVVDLDAVAQGEVLIAVIEGRRLHSDLAQQLLLVDPLPAGFEAEVPGLAGSTGLEGLDWLPALNPLVYADALDERWVAALDLAPEDSDTFRVAYRVRAVTPGRYRLGPVTVEDMYQPQFRASGSSEWVQIYGQ